jgi:hypothetical protein
MPPVSMIIHGKKADRDIETRSGGGTYKQTALPFNSTGLDGLTNEGKATRGNFSIEHFAFDSLGTFASPFAKERGETPMQ